MGAIDAGAVIIRLVADAKGVVTGVAQGTGAIRGFAANAQAIGAKMTSIGKGMTKWVTLPLLAIGAGAAKLSLDFEKTMTKVEALVGMTAGAVEKAKVQILAMAGEVGRSPQELGDAYYFLASSGLSASDSMKALRASALASAAGLGKTAVIADAVSSAMNAYGTETLSATKATDILLAAVREGKSEPEEFAGAIGRVIPIAQKMGVSFGEVAGMMAAMSLNGTDANEAVTQITAALTTAIKPTKEGGEALKTIGMSYADLRKEIADKGLVQTFDHLDRAFKGNVETLGAVFGNVRALRAIMTLTGPSMAKYLGIVKDVSKASGDTAKAAEIALSKPGAKIEKAWAKIQAALIEAGDIIVPVLADIADSVGGVAEAFGSLPDGTQRTIVKLLALVAIAGPFVLGIGKMTTALLGLRAAMSGAAAMKGLAGLAGAAGAAGALPGAAAGAGAAGVGAAGAAVGLSALIPIAVAAVGVGVGLALAKANQAQSVPREVTKPGNTFGLSVDEKKAQEAIHRIVVRVNNLKARLAEKMAMGLDTSGVEKKLNRAQIALNLYHDLAQQPIAAGHLTTTQWQNGFKRGETGFRAFKSHVTAGIDTGALNTSAWTNAMWDAYRIFLNIKAGMQAPISSHMTVSVTKNVQTQYTPLPAHPQATGGDYLVTGPTLFLAGEAGPERATFTPQGKGTAGAAGAAGGERASFELNFYGPVYGESDFVDLVAAAFDASDAAAARGFA